MTRKKGNETFRIGLATPRGMKAQLAYFTPAVGLGYDREEGLKFDFFYGGEPAATARSLCAGKCDIASLNTIVGFLGRFNENLPMLAIGSKARRAHRYFAVLPESPIRTLADIDGKRIACDFSHLQHLADAALSEDGVASGAYEWVPWRGSGMSISEMVAPLRRGEVDAMFLMEWNDGDAKARGLKLKHLRSSLLERIRVSSCYWTTDAIFAAKKDALARGLKVIQKSLAFSFANPEATVRIMWENYPESRPADGDSKAALLHDVEVLKACLEPMRIDAADPDPRWCAISLDEMKAWLDSLRRAGTVKAAADVRSLYTTELVDRANDFDPKSVRDAARAYASG